MNPTQANREAIVRTALGQDVLLFAGMSGREELGRLSEFTVHLLSTDANLKIADVLGKPMTVELKRNPDGDLRYFNGIVTRLQVTGWNEGFPSYDATVHPWLWLLTRSTNCRIFQDVAVPDIVKKVCEPYGGAVSLDAGSLSGDYKPLTYCVQYRESDFDFVCRLLEQAGIYFYFTHEADKHTMVLADSYAAHNPIPGYESLKFERAERAGEWTDESVHSWTSGAEIVSSKYVLNDFDFEKTSNSLNGGLLATANVTAGFAQPSYEMYDYPGTYTEVDAGSAVARARMEGLHGQCERALALSNARGLYPGGLFTLADHPRDDQNRQYLVTSARYEVVGNDYTSGGGGFVFQCTAGAVGRERPYRPLPSVARPVMRGPQTAIVVGKAGEEIWTDKYGRIKVQFHWDRQGRGDENSSCWVRVAQGWAGKGWGALALPRIGMEVIVSFLEGDPDRPLVTGCLYNSEAMPPYDLPAEQTKSSVKSQSTIGGNGFNELRFEDKKGKEEVYMHAERDFLRVVKRDDTLQVGRHQKVKIDDKQEVSVGTTIVIEAGTSIELKVGGSSIKIEAAKITVKSPEIKFAADANAKFEAGAMMEIKAGAVMTIGASMVQIN